MPDLLMPKATAVWLVDNTALSFDQIAEFCALHLLEVQAIADGDVATGIVGQNPIISGQLTKEEIERCEADPDARLVMIEKDLPLPSRRAKGPRYTPVSKRGDKPDAIAWVLKNHPEVTDSQIMKLIGTTKQTINAVRTKSHHDSANIKPRHPILLGLCTAKDFEEIVGTAPAMIGFALYEDDNAPADV